MTRFLYLACLLGLWAQTTPAQDAAGWIEELRELRKVVEQQSKQIESLTQQVARLNAASQGKSTEAPAPSVTTSAPETAAAPAPAEAPGKDDFKVASAPKAEAVPHHVVVKGETLTSIAKQYNVSLTELMKANKGLDARKLQIGQSILLPASTQTTPSESKPNP